mgnify:CR=1 FL=1
MKKEHKKLIAFLKKYGGWQWYGNDRATRKLVLKLVNRGFCIKRKHKLNNGYIFREVKLVAWAVNHKGIKKRTGRFVLDYGSRVKLVLDHKLIACLDHSLAVIFTLVDPWTHKRGSRGF